MIRIVEDGEEVGTVSFGPYSFEYSGGDSFVRRILEGANEYTDLDTGVIDEETEMPREGFVDVAPHTRRRMLKSRFETYDVQFSERAARNQLSSALSTGSVVETPDGKGVVDEIITSLGEDEDIEGTDLDPNEESVYVVALVSGGVGFFQSSDVSSAAFDVEQPGPIDETVQSANTDALPFANDWTMPETWRESPKPSRLILLDAWASMGGQFDCGGSCCMGELHSERLCAAMKDEVLGTTEWRGGWVS